VLIHRERGDPGERADPGKGCSREKGTIQGERADLYGKRRSREKRLFQRERDNPRRKG
jgi:hypothetical protein